jgi:cyclophilin family peptidyl-prolyl cis-trans isomerase/HEAT repeat protein
MVILSAAACVSSPPPRAVQPVSPPLIAHAEDYGLTVEAEAQILSVEDRRQYYGPFVEWWVAHPNALHRQRIALALARIGPHAFVDQNGNGTLDAGEKRAGVAELERLAGDRDRRVRETTAFALGEIGDPGAAPALFRLAADDDGAVSAEAAEALSKLGQQPAFASEHLARYLTLTGEARPEGPRARAVRFLFRFDDDRAGAAAVEALASPSSAIRQEAAYALSRRPYPAALDRLTLVATDPSVLTRAYAITALGRISEAQTVPLLVHALGDVHPWVRTNAAVALARTLGRHSDAVRESFVPRLIAASEDPDPGVRAATLEAIGFFVHSSEAARRRLLDILANGTQWERELAAGTIARHFAPGSEPYQRLTSLSPWQAVRIIEATAAAPHGAEVRREWSRSPDAFVRATAVASIPDATAAAEAKLIREAMQDPDVVVRANAYGRYTHMTTDSLELRVSTLEQAASNEQTASMNDARIAAIEAAVREDHPGRLRFLTDLLSDPDPVVRRIAANLIADKGLGPLPAYTPLPILRSAAEYEEIVRWSREPHTATIHMIRGDIQLALLTQDAPITTWNFAQLARKGFFDNTTFMRVVPNFVIQGGDPRNDMNGGPGYAIRDEINLQKYTRGALGMALSGPDTGGSQFFITHSPQPHLDGGYTIFGRVYDGMSSVVDQTERGDRVRTISIDERPPAGAAEIGSVPNVSLPLEIGEMSSARLLERLPEYSRLKAAYQPDLTVIEMMKSYVRPDDHVEVYMGTWCHDSEREVPRLLRIVDDMKAQYDISLPVRYFALDRSKQKPETLVNGKRIGSVATFVYYRGARELGRIVERPAALFEDDLLALAAAD